MKQCVMHLSLSIKQLNLFLYFKYFNPLYYYYFQHCLKYWDPLCFYLFQIYFKYLSTTSNSCSKHKLFLFSFFLTPWRGMTWNLVLFTYLKIHRSRISKWGRKSRCASRPFLEVFRTLYVGKPCKTNINHNRILTWV